MSCKACEEFQATDSGVYWFRWGTANIALLGCREHIGEVMQVLRDHIRPPAPGTGGSLSVSGNRSTTVSGQVPAPTRHILRSVCFKFDDSSRVSLDRLVEQGHLTPHDKAILVEIGKMLEAVRAAGDEQLLSGKNTDSSRLGETDPAEAGRHSDSGTPARSTPDVDV